jgi:hypothetical protein
VSREVELPKGWLKRDLDKAAKTLAKWIKTGRVIVQKK